MKLAKTFCKPNSTITIVPVGLPVILQYNEHGLLQKVSVGFGANLKTSTSGTFPIEDQKTYSKFFDNIKKRVPVSILTKGGTTWVYGVMHRSGVPCRDGIIPQCLYQDYIDDIAKGDSPYPYEFFGGFVHSLANLFQGPLVIRNFLSSNRFTPLPEVIVPLTITDDTLMAAMHTEKYAFDLNYISGFFVYESLECRYAPANLKQLTVVKNPELIIEEDGFWKGQLIAENETVNFSYSALLHHKVTKGTTVLMEEVNGSYEIIDVRVRDSAKIIPLSNNVDIQCPVCKRFSKAGISDAPVQCSDPNCMSHNYQNATKMLKVLGLEPLEYSDYKKAVDDKTLQCLTDVLELPQYKDQTIQTTLATAMYSVIPADVVPNFSLLERFDNKCNHSLDTVMHYIQNPLHIQTDLDLTDAMVAKLADWLQDPYNITTLTTIFERVELVRKVAKFEGSPIFRGNTIAITGRFKRGELSEIESILASYSADVVTSIEPGDKLPDVVITGGLNERISGQLIQKAHAQGIKIIDEDTFFESYEIDKDLAANLL